MKTCEVWTDGSCEGNPGRGGWAAVLRFGEHQKEIFGHAEKTTNQRMELTAAVAALTSFKQPVHVKLHSDSAYLINAMTQGWVDRWQRTDWMNAGKEPVANQDLWKLILAVIEERRLQVEWIKVKGHADDPTNNQADALAWIAARSQSEERCIHGYPEQLPAKDCKLCNGAAKELIASQTSLNI